MKRGNINQLAFASEKIQPEIEVKILVNINAEIIGLYLDGGNEIPKKLVINKIGEYEVSCIFKNL